MSIMTQELKTYVDDIYSGKNSDVDAQWGRASMYYFPDPVAESIKELGVKTVLDYGCGYSEVTNTLAKELVNTRFERYDPLIAEFSNFPKDSYDLVMCNSVLHMLDSHELMVAINNMHQLSTQYVFVFVPVAGARQAEEYVRWHAIFAPLFDFKHKACRPFENIPLHHAKHGLTHYMTFQLEKRRNK